MKDRIVKTYEVFKEQEEDWWDKNSQEGDNQIFAPSQKPENIDPYNEEEWKKAGEDIDDIDDDDIADDAFINGEIEREARELTQEYVDDMLDNGLSKEDIISFVQDYLSNKE